MIFYKLGKMSGTNLRVFGKNKHFLKEIARLEPEFSMREGQPSQLVYCINSAPRFYLDLESGRNFIEAIKER